MNKSAILLVTIAVVGIVSFNTFFVVDEFHTAIVLQFGMHMKTIHTAGLKAKVPFVQDVLHFDKRIMEWDGQANKIPTRDKKFIWVDTTARWKITDPLKYYQRVRDEFGAQKKLDDIIDGINRDVVSNAELIEIVRSTNRDMRYSEEFYTQAELQQKVKEERQKQDQELEQKGDGQIQPELLKIKEGRDEIARRIIERSKKQVGESDLGFEIIDVLIKRVNYTEEVQEKVYGRMISERQKVAEQYRAEGEGQRARILGDMEKKLKEIRSGSYRKAEEIKGKADAEATAIYANAYQKAPEFYAFLKALQNYHDSIDERTYFIFSTDNEYLKYLKHADLSEDSKSE